MRKLTNYKLSVHVNGHYLDDYESRSRKTLEEKQTMLGDILDMISSVKDYELNLSMSIGKDYGYDIQIKRTKEDAPVWLRA